MSTAYPGAVDSLTNPTAADDLDTSVGGADHPAQHANLNDGMEAVQTFVGPSGAVAGPTTIVGRVKLLEAGPTFPPTTQNRGFRAWSFDPVAMDAAGVLSVTTVVRAVALYLPACTISNIYFACTTAQTPTNAFAALYDSTGAQLGTSAQLGGVSIAVGLTTCPLTAPVVVSAGYYYVSWHCAGGNMPSMARAYNAISTTMVGLRASGAPIPTSTSATAATTSAPSPLGVLTAVNYTLWAAVS